MELIKEYSQKQNKYSEKILIIKYTEGEGMVIKNEGVKDILELIIGNNELEYNNIEKSSRNKYIVNKKLEIIENFIHKDNYSKKFNQNLLQKSFQNINYLSSILYLNEYYKINCIIYNHNTNKYYKTSFKKYPELICIYRNNSWFLGGNDPPDENLIHYDMDDLSNIITIDTELMIYKPYLQAISKYKLADLKDMCNEVGLSTSLNGKNKLKKELYDNINQYYVQKD
ncbi:MAG: hypothetical protein CMH79_04245 [Nitrospinae bacterium]|nr:hypothetical protein [Nitrospinota bacterium]